MKILIVMTGFFPGQKFGGPPVSVDNFCTLMDGDDCFIVTRNHDMGESKVYLDIEQGWNNRGNCKVLYLSDKEYRYSSFENIIKGIKPDIIYLQGLFQNCIIPCLFLAKKYKISVMLAPRGELCSGAFKKKYKKVPYIIFLRMFKLLKNVHFQSTSDEETTAIMNVLSIEKERIHFLSNVPSIPQKQYVREKKKVGEGKFVFISRIHPKKNLISAIDYLKNVKGKVVFDIYGPIEDEEYWKQCNQKIRELPDNVTVKYCGLISHEKIHETFSKYDAFLFPTFSENYGHVIAEALFAGTTVITSDQTPWTDINEGKAGWANSIEDKKRFLEAIQSVINQNDDDNKEQIDAIHKYLDSKVKLNDIRQEYKKAFDL